MNEVADFYERKREIGEAFLRAAPLPAKADAAYYRKLLTRLGVATRQEKSILLSVARDAIMAARREGRTDKGTQAFLDWLQFELASGK